LLSEIGVIWVTPKGCFQLLSTKLTVSGKGKRVRTLWDCLVHAMFWNLWMERNRRIFQEYAGATSEELWDRVKFWASVTGHFKDYHYSIILRDFSAVLR